MGSMLSRNVQGLGLDLLCPRLKLDSLLTGRVASSTFECVCVCVCLSLAVFFCYTACLLTSSSTRNGFFFAAACHTSDPCKTLSQPSFEASVGRAALAHGARLGVSASLGPRNPINP